MESLNLKNKVLCIFTKFKSLPLWIHGILVLIFMTPFIALFIYQTYQLEKRFPEDTVKTQIEAVANQEEFLQKFYEACEKYSHLSQQNLTTPSFVFNGKTYDFGWKSKSINYVYNVTAVANNKAIVELFEHTGDMFVPVYTLYINSANFMEMDTDSMNKIGNNVYGIMSEGRDDVLNVTIS